jgi:DNA-cytosine methyltransferase
MYTFIDLFAGIGGIRLAFEKHGAKCVFSSEWDVKAQETYSARFGKRPFGDIRKVELDEIPKHDILLAGFPCQPFSLAGVSKKNALGRLHGFADETQGTLFFEIAKIIKEKEPQAFLLENVKNLRSHDNNKTFRTIMRILQKELGYKVYDAVIDAKGVLPQHRERIYLVGFKEQLEFKFPDFPLEGPAISTILEKDVDDKYTLTDNLWRYLQDYAEKHKKAGNGFGYGLVDLKGPSRTLSARYYKDGAEILIPQEGKNPRRLTPRECARLQGFPDSFKIVVSDAAAYKQFGNSVAVPVVEKIAGQLIKSLQEHKIVEGYDRSKYYFADQREEVIVRASKYGEFFCKFISANDTGKNGGHRSGFYVPKQAHPMIFDEPGVKGENKDRSVRLYWEQLDYHTDSIFRYYGKGTRDEYRITRFGKGFPFFSGKHIGDLLIIIKVTKEEYIGYVLSGQDTEAFLATFSISPIENSYYYSSNKNQLESTGELIDSYIQNYAASIKNYEDFPIPENLAAISRELLSKANANEKFYYDYTDNLILEWIKIEYKVFRAIENFKYKDVLSKPFNDIDSLLSFANTALANRKRRAKYSFEFHLEYIFQQWDLSFTMHREKTDKSVDFSFFDNNGEPIISLFAQTTCKHTWENLLDFNINADLYLVTIEKGMNANILEQMKKNNIKLVIPESYRQFYPTEYRDEVLSLYDFCNIVKESNFSKKNQLA